MQDVDRLSRLEKLSSLCVKFHAKSRTCVVAQVEVYALETKKRIVYHAIERNAGGAAKLYAATKIGRNICIFSARIFCEAYSLVIRIVLRMQLLRFKVRYHGVASRCFFFLYAR